MVTFICRTPNVRRSTTDFGRSRRHAVTKAYAWPVVAHSRTPKNYVRSPSTQRRSSSCVHFGCRPHVRGPMSADGCLSFWSLAILLKVCERSQRTMYFSIEVANQRSSASFRLACSGPSFCSSFSYRQLTRAKCLLASRILNFSHVSTVAKAFTSRGSSSSTGNSASSVFPRPNSHSLSRFCASISS